MTLAPLLFAVSTFCNPLPIPDYPVGIPCRGLANGSKTEGLWKLPKTLQFRELADPTLLFEKGAWYLFPSAAQCWKSTDGGGTWTHIPLNLPGLGYAPTVVKHRGKFYLCGSDSPLFVAERPEGPWTDVGKIDLPHVEGAPGQWDPMLFSDDDGRLYLYYGCTPTGGIWGCELDAADPTRVVAGPVKLLSFEPQTQPWERVPGNPTAGWLEGSWMVKINGKYVLTYSASGTENATYAMGAALGEKPLGPFVKQANNPFFASTEGLVTGTGHGSVVKGPDGGYWVSYSICVGVNHGFERMIGMDRLFLDPEGGLSVVKPTSTPQWIPSVGRGATGWEALALKPNAGAEAACDGSFATWWVPGKEPLTVTFEKPRTVRAFRLVWRDIGLDEEKGVRRGPYRYTLEALSGGEWKTLVDASRNTRDLFVDYREVKPTDAEALRLTVLGGPAGITPAIAEFTPFGTPVQMSLGQKYAPHFKIGCAIDTTPYECPKSRMAKIVEREFTSVTSENAMKPDAIEPEEGVFDFERADRFVAWAEKRGMKIIGHTLVWHNQMPGWFFKDEAGNDCSRETLVARMRTYISTVVGRYKGRVAAWDVVNEALGDDGELHDSPWLRIIGPDFVELAFRFAAEADPEAELQYNDFSMDKPAKRAGTVRMIRDFKAKGVKIDTIGMQSHGSLAYPDYGEYEDSIAAFEAEGLKVAITELDISALPDTWGLTAEITAKEEYRAKLNPWPDGFLDPAVQERLADRYAGYFEIYLRHPGVNRVTFWGLSDKESWLDDFPMKGRTNYPLLFDRELHPKPCYFRLLNL